MTWGWPLYELLRKHATQSSAAGTLAGGQFRSLLDAFRLEGAVRQSSMAGAVSQAPSPADGLVDALTLREIEVLCLLAVGLSNKEIAGKLVIAPSTVKQHLKNIYGKLSVHNRTQAVARGRELGLL